MQKKNKNNMSLKCITELQCCFKTIPHRKHIAPRLNWAIARRNWIAIEWGKVMFIDQLSFIVRLTKLRVRVWRDEGTSCNSSNLIPTVRSESVSLSVRVGFQFVDALRSCVLKVI